MTLQELQKQILQLPIHARWHLVRSVLASIQQETLSSIPPSPIRESLTDIHPWTQSLIGLIQLPAEEQMETYIDYLEEKYH